MNTHPGQAIIERQGKKWIVKMNGDSKGPFQDRMHAVAYCKMLNIPHKYAQEKEVTK